MPDLAPVTVVIPTLDPEERFLTATVHSLINQTTPPDEVLIVDVTPGGFPFEVVTEQTAGDCTLCGNPVGKALSQLSASGSTVRVHHTPELNGLSSQRRFGIGEATNEFVAKFDEDTVLLNEDHLERSLAELEANDDVVAVGCAIRPIRKNLSGRVVSKLTDGFSHVGPYDTAYFPIHATHLCPDGESCFPLEHRGGDVSLKTHLRNHGEIRKLRDLEALTDLPTRKQARAMRVAGATVGGGLLSGALTGARNS